MLHSSEVLTTTEKKDATKFGFNYAESQSAILAARPAATLAARRAQERPSLPPNQVPIRVDEHSPFDSTGGELSSSPLPSVLRSRRFAPVSLQGDSVQLRDKLGRSEYLRGKIREIASSQRRASFSCPSRLDSGSFDDDSVGKSAVVIDCMIISTVVALRNLSLRM